MSPEQRAKDLIDRDWEYFDSGTHSVMYQELEKLIAAAFRAAEDAALERAARAAESEEEEPDTPEDEAMVAGYNRAVREIAAAIRNLKNYGDA